MFLILVDSFSKWVDVIPITYATSDETIEKLRTVFANFGPPEQIVVGNGSAFTSKEFETFLQRNGIWQIKTAPYHSPPNSQTERTIQTFKHTLNKMMNKEKGTINKKVQTFLMAHTFFLSNSFSSQNQVAKRRC